MLNIKLFTKAKETVLMLKHYGLKVSTAESCTGGMVATYITSVSGVSEVFELGITSYSNRIKNEILGVKSETLSDFGAVSKETALEMAINIKEKSGADFGISVTGVAGPDGSEGHPAGYVFIGISGEHGAKTKLLNINPKSRNYVREQTVFQIFELIQNYIKEFYE